MGVSVRYWLFYKLSILLAIVAFSQYSVAEIYKWVDEDGNVHFTDTPPKNKKTQKVTVKINSYQSVAVIPPKDDSSDSRKEPVRSKKVIMYSAEWCGVCRKAKKYFSEKRIAYKEIDIDKDKAGRIEFDKLNARGVPVIFVGKIRLNGFSPKHFEKVYYR